MFAAFMVAKLGPIVAHLIRIALEVIRLAALATGLAVVLAVLTWTAIHLIRWQQRRRTALAPSQARVFVMPERQQTESAEQQDCLACGGTGTVLRAIGSGRDQPGACPVCEPARQAG